MALRALLRFSLLFLVAAAGAGAVTTLLQQRDKARFNDAVASEDYATAAQHAGEQGRFAEAFGLALAGDVDEARVMYGDIGRAEDTALRAAAFYNLGNSYLRQAEGMDMEAETDRVYPLIELAKMNYRKSLAIDNSNWDARRNLQKALLLLPDANPKVPMEVEGRRGAVRTVTSADSEKNYP